MSSVTSSCLWMTVIMKYLKIIKVFYSSCLMIKQFLVTIELHQDAVLLSPKLFNESLEMNFKIVL